MTVNLNGEVVIAADRRNPRASVWWWRDEIDAVRAECSHCRPAIPCFRHVQPPTLLEGDHRYFKLAVGLPTCLAGWDQDAHAGATPPEGVAAVEYLDDEGTWVGSIASVCTACLLTIGVTR